MPFVQSIRARNVLSFGPGGLDLELRDLNVIIGPNASGKSNLVSLFSLLRSAPRDITRTVTEGGGIEEWIWKGGPADAAWIDVTLDLDVAAPLRYAISFRDEARRFRLTDERIEDAQGRAPYRSGNGSALFHGVAESVEPDVSVLAQRRGPERYREITAVAEAFARIMIYHDWRFGRSAPVRLPQRTDLPNDFLLADASNLALVLETVRFETNPAELRRCLQLASPDFESVATRTAGGTIQTFVEETGLSTPTPATRLSRGTLQLLCLLAVLLHPRPPRLVCLEEPESGLHPDILPNLADLLRDAATRTQLIVTTHSEILADALSSTPENVIVAEKHDGQTAMRRLSRSGLEGWLADYSLGQLWRKGTIGGNRW